MKHIYSVILMIVASAFSNAHAQGSESFTNIPASNGSYLTRTWTGDNSVSWTCTDARTDQAIAGPAIAYRNGTLTSATFANGVGDLTFKYKYLFTGSSASLAVKVNGTVVGTVAVPTTQTTAVSTTLTGVNISGNCFIEISQTVSGARVALDDLSWTAYTGAGDITPPVITSLIPADNAINAAVGSNLQLVFNENILAGSGDILIKNLADNSIFQTIAVNSANVSISSRTAQITHNTFINARDYYVEIPSGAFTDIASNAFTGISGNSTWNFTTAPVPAAGIIGTEYNFADCSNTFANQGWSQYSVADPAHFWMCVTPGRAAAPDNAVQMNAFVASNNNPLNEDWLISPVFDLSTATAPTLKFYSKGDFLGNSLQLKISNNYTPGTATSTAIWTDLNGNFPANVSGQGVWTLSDNIDLAAFNTTNVTIAWVYVNPNTTASSRWTIDDVTVYQGVVLPPCTEPASQPTALVFSGITTTSISGSFTAATAADNYIVVQSLNSTLSATPQDATPYTVGQALGGGIVVANSAATSFTANGLTQGTTYYYFVFSYNNVSCTGGPLYLETSPLSGNVTTAVPAPCVTPAAPTTLTLTPGPSSITGSFTGSGASKYLVYISATTPFTGTLVNGTSYAVNSTNGNGTVVSYGAASNFTATGLNSLTTYYLFVFAANDGCVGEPFYSANSLSGTATTTANTIPAGYYDAATGLSCAPLKTALNGIITNGHIQLNYGQLDDIQMPVTDNRTDDNGNGNYVWDIYSDNPNGPEPYLVTFSQFATNINGEGNGWNKEHSFPNSWFSPTSSTGNFPGADMMHLYPTDQDVNSLRSNYPYGVVATPTTTTLNGSKLGSSAITFPGYSGPVFEPIDAYKGDLARSTLYMVTRYQAEQPTWESYQTGGDVVMDGTTYPSIEIEYLRMLINWHNADPVSAKEIERNNDVYGFQGNRNPFVDHPEYVNQVWNPTCGLALPVTLISFEAQWISKTVELTWEAEKPQNFSHFVIERSTDGLRFSPIGTQLAAPGKNYKFTDRDLPAGAIAYYRLKLVDVDAKYSNSKILSVKLKANAASALVYPNPASSMLEVKLYEALSANSILYVIDATGRRVVTQQVAATSTKLKVDVSKLAAGKYYVSIVNGIQNIKEGFMITR